MPRIPAVLVSALVMASVSGLAGCGGGSDPAQRGGPSGSTSRPADAQASGPEALFAAFQAAVRDADAGAFVAMHTAASRDAQGAAFKQMFADMVEDVQRRPPYPAKQADLAKARKRLAENLGKLGMTGEQFDAASNEQFLLRFLDKAFAGEAGLDFWLAKHKQTAAGTLRQVRDAGENAKVWIVEYEIAPE